MKIRIDEKGIEDASIDELEVTELGSGPEFEVPSEVVQRYFKARKEFEDALVPFRELYDAWQDANWEAWDRARRKRAGCE